MELSVSEVIHAATTHLTTVYGRPRASEIQDAARAAIDAHVARHGDLAAALTTPIRIDEAAVQPVHLSEAIA